MYKLKSKNMKNLIIVLMMCGVSLGNAQVDKTKPETKRAVAMYTGYSNQGYYFTNDLDQSSMLFKLVNPEVLKKYDLKDRKYIRETFRVYYNVEMQGQKQKLTIINMELLDYDEEEEEFDRK
jgi:hypothetical protein